MTKWTKAQTTKVERVRDALVAAAPAGWHVTQGDGWHDGHEPWAEHEGRWVRFARGGDVETAWCTEEEEAVVLNLHPFQRGDTWYRDHAFSGVVVEGHTLAGGGCFTRRGVDTHSCALVDSAEHRYSNDYGDLAALLQGESERCQRSLARRKTAQAVPGTPFTRQPEWFAESAATLRAGRIVRLEPHGFGTGYELSTRRLSFATRADARLEAALGVTPLYVRTFDAD